MTSNHLFLHLVLLRVQIVAEDVRVLEHAAAVDDHLVGRLEELDVDPRPGRRLLQLHHALLRGLQLFRRELLGLVVAVVALVVVEVPIELALGTPRRRELRIDLPRALPLAKRHRRVRRRQLEDPGHGLAQGGLVHVQADDIDAIFQVDPMAMAALAASQIQHPVAGTQAQAVHFNSQHAAITASSSTAS